MLGNCFQVARILAALTFAQLLHQHLTFDTTHGFFLSANSCYYRFDSSHARPTFLPTIFDATAVLLRARSVTEALLSDTDTRAVPTHGVASLALRTNLVSRFFFTPTPPCVASSWQEMSLCVHRSCSTCCCCCCCCFRYFFRAHTCVCQKPPHLSRFGAVLLADAFVLRPFTARRL